MWSVEKKKHVRYDYCTTLNFFHILKIIHEYILMNFWNDIQVIGHLQYIARHLQKVSASEIRSTLSNFLFNSTQGTWSTSCITVINAISYSVWSHLYTQNWLSLQWNSFSIVLILIEFWCKLFNGEWFIGNRCRIVLKSHLESVLKWKDNEILWNQRKFHFMREDNTRHRAKILFLNSSYRHR